MTSRAADESASVPRATSESPSSPRRPFSLTISIVTYAPDLAVLSRCVVDLRASAVRAVASGWLARCRLVFVDNGPGDAHARDLAALLDRHWPADAVFASAYRPSGGNIGYGRAHNLAIAESGDDFHLVCNPDIYADENTIERALAFCHERPDVGLLAPAIFAESGERQFLCKRNPTVLDLFLRGFGPSFLKRLAAHRLARYEMRDLDYAGVIEDVPYVSGCFMLLRGAIVRGLGGFDPDFFMYLEDADLARRVLTVAHTAYVPSVRVTHLWSRGTHNNWKLRWVTVHSSYVYFRKWGVKAL